MTNAVRFRIKGTTTYVDPVAVASGKRVRMENAYTTAGIGQRSQRWRGLSVGPNAALDGAQGTLRNQSRDLVRKNGWAGAAVERVVSNVVGIGIKPKLVDKAQSDLWQRWTDQADAAGVLDFYGLQSLAMASVMIAGEVFARKRVRRKNNAENLTVPLQIELLESEMCPAEKNEVLPGGNTVRQGIEFHSVLKSKRVAYWFHKTHPDDNTPGIRDNTPFRVPAEEVLHVFVPTRPGQIRGEPWMAKVLARLKDVDAYDASELQRKKLATLFVGFIRRPPPESLSIDDLEEMYGSGAEINDGVGDVNLDPSAMNVLAPGEEVEFTTPPDTGNNYEAFMRQQARVIASSLGLLYEQLTGDFSQVNDRTWRAAIQDFRRRCEVWQHNLVVYQFSQPIFRTWALIAGLSGADTASDPLALIEWTPPRWPYINPEQDIKAINDEILAGITSRKRVVNERGDEVERIDEEQSEDNARADEHGHRYSSDGRVINPDQVKVEEAKAKFAPKPAAAAPAKASTDDLAVITRALAAKPAPVGIVLPEKMLTFDAARPTITEVEDRDDQGRILSLLIRPTSGVGPTIRRTTTFDRDGRMTGHEDTLLTETTDG